MIRYCDYCGSGYIKFECQVCHKEFETCNCEDGVLCGECADKAEQHLPVYGIDLD